LKVAVIGANGQLGSDICSCFSDQGLDVIQLSHGDIEIADVDSVAHILKQSNAPVVINTAAMHHVEKCENDPVQAFKANAIGSRNLALVCNETKSKLIHISTDYVFDGRKNKPYVEDDTPAPLNVYANSKLSGEYFVSSVAERFHIVRVGGLYGKYACRAKGNDFVELMQKLARERDEVRVVDDEVVTPTSTAAIARQLSELIKADAENGIYHATAEGSCSWYEFAKAIFSILNLQTELNIADPAEFPMKVKRPKYSVLENRHLKQLGINHMQHWKDELGNFLSNQ